MKYIIILALLLPALVAAAEQEPLDEDDSPDAITQALEKAREEFKTFALDSNHLNTFKKYYELNLTDIIICNFVRFYLAGTCDLHELLAIAKAIKENETTLIALPDEPDYEQLNREFLDRLATYYDAFTTKP